MLLVENSNPSLVLSNKRYDSRNSEKETIIKTIPSNTGPPKNKHFNTRIVHLSFLCIFLSHLIACFL